MTTLTKMTYACSDCHMTSTSCSDFMRGRCGECYEDKEIRDYLAEQVESAELEARILAQKVNPDLDRGVEMKVLMRHNDDGTVTPVMPMGCPPDTAGFSRNRAFQAERVWKVQSRLKRKLEKKQKTLVDYARELEQKALTPSK
jgi:hypothetical protein